MPLVSIVIRARNEERWIGRCLRMVFRQDFADFEVVLVDNQSTDHTREIAAKFPVKIIGIDGFLPGKALNAGIRASQGGFIVCLSAHCIPRDKHWLSGLCQNMTDEAVAGVYGRQLPMSYSSALDKRDLINTFGLDRRVQIKDSFFHNANSMVRRSVWERIPFDETVTNIEDRIWGRAVIAAGLRLVYEPDAAVYHHHGIHQDGDVDRAGAIVRILESLDGAEDATADALHLRLLAILPVLGPAVRVAGVDLLDRCLAELESQSLLQERVVVADDPQALETARRRGAAAMPRPPELSRPEATLELVLQHALACAERDGLHYDAVVYVNYLFPFRPAGFFERLLTKFRRSGADSLVPTMPDYFAAWAQASDGRLERSDSGFVPHRFKEPIQRGLSGLGTVSRSEFIRRGRLLGDDIALVNVEGKLHSMKANDPFDMAVIGISLEQGVERFQRRESPRTKV